MQPSSPKLLNAIPEGGLRELWESEPIPSNNEGGRFGSEALVQLGHQSTSELPPELVAKIEAQRMALTSVAGQASALSRGNDIRVETAAKLSAGLGEAVLRIGEASGAPIPMGSATLGRELGQCAIRRNAESFGADA